jgi:TetR/AcrR family transcriptional regulator, transcriptional repressor of bet genes
MTAVVDVTVAGGLEAVTFRSVAEQAGVSVRLVQYYFGDKKQLLSDTLTFAQTDIADLVRTGMAALGDGPAPRDALQVVCESFLPVDERRRRAMLVFLSFGTAALTDDTLQGPEGLRRGQGLANVIEAQLRAVRSDDHVADDALLLVMEIVGLGNGILAGDVTEARARDLVQRMLDRALRESAT